MNWSLGEGDLSIKSLDLGDRKVSLVLAAASAMEIAYTNAMGL
jgi:hypothetical protein